MLSPVKREGLEEGDGAWETLMATPLSVLILEDRESDAELMLHELRRAGFKPQWQRVETEQDYLAHLHPALDVILADYTLPQFDALRALHLLQKRGLDIPFIVVTGSISEEVAVECMKQGAADYLLKDRLARLGPAVVQALKQRKLREEKRQAEAALRESEARFRRLAENAVDLIYRYRFVPTRGFEYVSPAATAMTGYTTEEHYADPDLGLKLVHPDDRPLLEAFMQAPVEVNTSFILRWIRKDGTMLWTDHRIVPVRDEMGNVVAVEGIARDITDQMRARIQLEEIARLKDQMIQNISHELRMPLTIIKGYLGLLLEGALGELPAEAQEALKTVNRRSEDIVAMVERITTLYGLRLSGLHIERLSLSELVRRAVARRLDTARQASLVLELDLPDEEVLVEGNTEQLAQALDCLLDNAIKFNSLGGRISVCLSSANDMATVEITDTGVGIPADQLERIWERFYQVDGSTTRRYGGMGVGLALVKEVIEAHGGTVWAKSLEGQGSTFGFALRRV